MKKNIKYIFSLLLVGGTLTVSANGTDSLSMRKYSMEEEWYFQAQGGINYTVADNTKYVGFTKMLSPQFSISLGKRFSPVWGLRMQLSFGTNRGVYYPKKDSEMFDFTNRAVYGIGTFNITELLDFRKRRAEHRWHVILEAGLGAIYTDFGYTDDITKGSLNRNNSTFATLFAGVEVARTLSEHWDMGIELSTNWMSERFNGQKSVKNGFKADGMVNLMVGLRYNFQRAVKKQAQAETAVMPTFTTVTQTAQSQKTPIVKKTVAKPEQTASYSLEELLEKVENGENIKGKHLSSTECITFDFGKAGIKSFHMIYLDNMVELVKKSNAVLMIRGFVAARKSPFHDMVTEQRMNAVRDYVISKGVHRDRIIYQYIKESETPFTKDGQEQTIEFGIMTL